MSDRATPVSGSDGMRRSVTAILACHNRRALTLRALDALYKARDVFDLSIVLFDDGSTDGTATEALRAFPAVTILMGDGNAFWNGGMYRAWQHALGRGADGYLWLNDDVLLDTDALARVAMEWRQTDSLDDEGAVILVGATRDSAGELTYGGMKRTQSPFALKFERLPIVEKPAAVDTFNGNIVLVTAAAARRVGIIDPAFHHKFGDVDYGLRASAKGVPVLLLPGTLGVCEGPPPFDLGSLSLRERWRWFGSYRGVPFASWWLMTRKYSGIWRLPHFLLAYRRMFYPAALLRRRK